MSKVELFADRYDIEEYCQAEQHAHWKCQREQGASACQPQFKALNKCSQQLYVLLVEHASFSCCCILIASHSLMVSSRSGNELANLNKNCQTSIQAFNKCRSAAPNSECRPEAAAVHKCYTSS
jgi:hypothetical protein